MRLVPAMLLVALVTPAVAEEPPHAHATTSAPPPSTVAHWRGARALDIVGTLTALVGTGLSLSSTIYVLVTDYPPSENDFLHPARPTDTAPVLAYAGSSASALGFLLSAGGLGWQHEILAGLGADPGRGYYGGGTALGAVGTLSVGASYFFGLTSYLGAHDQSIAVLTTSLGGALLCTIGSILYAKDAARMKKVWAELNSF